MKDESEVQQLIQLEAAKYNIILMRNNSGAFKDSTGRWVRYGLGNISKKHNTRLKSSDLIGIIPPYGILIAVECKPEGWEYTGKDRELAQYNFIQWVRDRGGVAGFCASVEDFHKLIREYV